jgi:hypothetical protein
VDAPVTPQGVGAIRIGMTFTVVQRIGGVADRLSPALEADDADAHRPGGHLLTLRTRGAANGLLFETDGERVVRIRVGSWQVSPQ